VVVGQDFGGKFPDDCDGRGHHLRHGRALVDLADIWGEDTVFDDLARLVCKHSNNLIILI
jgi:hypothetical protein